ncbi:MAG: dihydrodipicolinate synthase family protein [Pirellulaceae bacterium]|nr:dihydrodipicolinate synthase family protein [Pirellulaceae bacterium]
MNAQSNCMPTIRPGRKILGISAVLLPLTCEDQVDWQCFRKHVEKTLQAGLMPAVNMDTGYANLIDEETRQRVLVETQSLCSGAGFAAGAWVGDHPNRPCQITDYFAPLDAIQSCGGTPVIFQSYGLKSLGDEARLLAYRQMGEVADRYIGFELGEMFAPFGQIYSVDFYRQWIQIPQCIGAKHSSLDRQLEWQRLAIRDCLRPEFHVFTGNDLAIDMVMYGSDYLLGLSTMAPDWFAVRDRLWELNDPSFYSWNDWLQYLGFLAFRDPVPAYKHSAAQFLQLRGWINSNRAYPGCPLRPDSDISILETFLRQCPMNR